MKILKNILCIVCAIILGFIYHYCYEHDISILSIMAIIGLCLIGYVCFLIRKIVIKNERNRTW
jgi:hypothetical protein